jgi:tRNA(Arg) A34 adenosine deaminase TadA
MICPTRRRLSLLTAVWPLTHGTSAAAAGPDLVAALARAHALRDEALRAGDQPYGAVVWLDGRIVGEAPSRVVSSRNADAHAEREALLDARRRLGRDDLAGAWLVSSSRPCWLCETAAARAGIARMVFGDGIDGGAPRLR